MASKLLRLYQCEDGYCYNSDSLFLYDFARDFIQNMRAKTILDIGAGSGILGLLCARDFQSFVSLVEKDRDYAFLARKNAKSFGDLVEVVCGDIFEFRPARCYDVIISNPPFYRKEILDSQNQKINLARNERFMPLQTLCAHIKRLLSPKGRFIFCYDAKEIHRVLGILQDSKLNAQTLRFVHPRLDKPASLALIEAKINAKGSLKILPPLFTHLSKQQTDITKEVKRIYELCNTYSIKVKSTDLCKGEICE